MRRGTKPFRAIGALVLVGFGAGCARSASPPVEPDDAAERTAATLRPGDVIRLEIWREATLSGDFTVNEDGKTVLPKIGELEATTEPMRELEARIREEYGRYLRNPSINVTFLRRITVMGAVRSPGMYPIDPTVTVADALALAGGALSYGEPNEVRLYRSGRMLTADINQVTRIDALPIRSGDQLYVPERSWFERHTGIIATLISSAVTLTTFVISITRDD